MWCFFLLFFFFFFLSSSFTQLTEQCKRRLTRIIMFNQFLMTNNFAKLGVEWKSFALRKMVVWFNTWLMINDEQGNKWEQFGISSVQHIILFGCSEPCWDNQLSYGVVAEVEWTNWILPKITKFDPHEWRINNAWNSVQCQFIQLNHTHKHIYFICAKRIALKLFWNFALRCETRKMQTTQYECTSNYANGSQCYFIHLNGVDLS